MSTGLKERQEVLLVRIHKLIDTLVQNYLDFQKHSGYSVVNNISFDIVPGTKYYKLISRDGQAAVHAFVDKQTGAVYKPASWKAPAKHVRYNLLDDVSFETCLKKADWAGGYLYM